MKRDDEKGKEKQVSSKTLQAMSPNVLATRYLREANKKFKLGDYAEAAEVYKQAINYFEIAIHGGVSISKSNYTNAIYNWVTTLYYNRKYEEALEAFNTYILSIDVQYIDLSILLHTQKDLCYNVGLEYIKKGDFPSTLNSFKYI